jgi:hypothetical protein
MFFHGIPQCPEQATTASLEEFQSITYHSNLCSLEVDGVMHCTPEGKRIPWNDIPSAEFGATCKVSYGL